MTSGDALSMMMVRLTLLLFVSFSALMAGSLSKTKESNPAWSIQVTFWGALLMTFLFLYTLTTK